MPKNEEKTSDEKFYEAFLAMGLEKTEFMSTGIAELDAIKCIPRNKISLFYGPEGVGKSTVALKVALNASNNGEKVLYLDSEGAVTVERLKSWGFNPEFFKFVSLGFIEEIYQALTEGYEQYDLIVVDSLAGASFYVEDENEAGAANIGTKAKILNKLMRILPTKIAQSKTTVLLINQERADMNGYGTYMPGGKGQSYASSHTIRLATKANKRFTKNKQVAGHWVEAEIRKSRVAMPFQKVEFKLYYE